MKTFLIAFAILALAVWITDNNTHYILKGLLAAWPLFLLLGIGGFLVWQGLGTDAHTRYSDGHYKGLPHGDPAEAARERAEKQGISLPKRKG